MGTGSVVNSPLKGPVVIYVLGGTAARAGLVGSPKNQAGAENSNYDFSPNALSNTSVEIQGKWIPGSGISKVRALGGPA